MKRLFMAAAAVLAVVGSVWAVEKSGLQEGQSIPAFNVCKVGGAADDGVSDGKELCYRCKYGSRPMVMVFTRKTGDEKLAQLVKQLDAAVAKNADAQLRVFVNVMADSRDAAEASAKDLLAKAAPTKVPVVVPVEFKNGPDNYGINPEAELTIIMAQGGKVTANHTFDKGLSCDSCIESVVADVNKLVTK